MPGVPDSALVRLLLGIIGILGTGLVSLLGVIATAVIRQKREDRQEGKRLPGGVPGARWREDKGRVEERLDNLEAEVDHPTLGLRKKWHDQNQELQALKNILPDLKEENKRIRRRLDMIEKDDESRRRRGI